MAEYTPKLQTHKVDAVGELKTAFGESKDFILADYRGLNVEQITDLRGQLREKGASFKVIKNRFAKIALNELEYPDMSDQFIGPTAVALTTEEAGPAAKVLVDFSVGTPMDIKGGLVDGLVFDGDQIKAFSKLPTKMELISQLMSVMNGPVRNLMYALQGVPQKLVRTLQAVADQKAENG
ncbi:MAG: 50S ribosomal protein L10 [Spirochaetales bacterium]|jgi:large subunit ribosomal protein L10|nr:50S ribosomal protein L10 [Spirochaetales bacterium]